MTSDIRDRVLAAARQRVREIDSTALRAELAAGRVLIDVREAVEVQQGAPEGALHLPRSALELRIAEHALRVETPIAVICAGGNRSLLCAQTLLELGFVDVVSVQGGFDAWKAAGLPVVERAGDADWYQRYARHLSLSEIGEAGQRRLQSARVLVIGAGGLGSPVLLYLAAAGVGQLTVIDDDRVERSNLQRQVLHGEARIGMFKAESARITLNQLNPRIRVEPLIERVDADNVDRLLQAHDLVIDGSDNLATRYCVSDACVRIGRPLVFAAVHRFEGQITVFDAGRRPGQSPCYRCLFPQPPSAAFAPNCSEVGVLGVTPGVLGLLQANEAVKLLLQIGDTLDGRLLTLDLLSMRFRETRLRPDPACPACSRPGGARLDLPSALCSAS